MARKVNPGDCVKIADGRVARVREVDGRTIKVRVRRKTSETHQFLFLDTADVDRVECPEGWMSPSGYTNYLRKTLAKMRERKNSR
jgi:hypothetical protein